MKNSFRRPCTLTLESVGLYRHWRTEACRDRGSSRRFLTGIFDLSSIFLLCRDSRRNHIHVHEEDFAKASLLRLEFISKVISVFKPKLYLVDRQQRREEPPPRQGGRLHLRHPQVLSKLTFVKIVVLQGPHQVEEGQRGE